MRPKCKFLKAVGFEAPIIQAPMAGSNGSAMVVAVCRAGDQVRCRVPCLTPPFPLAGAALAASGRMHKPGRAATLLRCGRSGRGDGKPYLGLSATDAVKKLSEPLS